ncbi:hypothetical protein O1611_g1774 [Lasiodiplodia mahajangana]|uniref:Uncharacterized protein n=1 Tax=Lasiodiplodia mahajangana TaxID=1108764 RepID=A0ACC2JWS5_9PEZI|nr:hypothetical protein O1611_g1774 [Lasiodiplodia mahajangana]
MATEAAERFEAELDLLHAMYPESLSFSSKARELKYSYCEDESSGKSPAILLLRLPDTYPLDGSPEVISATGHYKEDLRSATKAAFCSIGAPKGEEVLDVLLLTFRDLILAQEDSNPRGTRTGTKRSELGKNDAPANRTVVVWLHHLLNTNKRKKASNPSVNGSKISGVTKPGYPGVLIFSGERNAVESHLSELRNQRWQAFRVRYDTDDGEEPSGVWQFKHGTGVCEVESMSDVAQSIVNPQQRDVFLTSIGVK